MFYLGSKRLELPGFRAAKVVGQRRAQLVTKDSIRVVTATVHQEGAWCVAQGIEVDVASQGESRDEALANLREALELYFMPSASSAVPLIEVRVTGS